MSVREGRVLSLDGLRGLGALLVFLYHIDIMVHPFGEGGYRASFQAVPPSWCSSSFRASSCPLFRLNG